MYNYIDIYICINHHIIMNNHIDVIMSNRINSIINIILLRTWLDCSSATCWGLIDINMCVHVYVNQTSTCTHTHVRTHALTLSSFWLTTRDWYWFNLQPEAHSLLNSTTNTLRWTLQSDAWSTQLIKISYKWSESI